MDRLADDRHRRSRCRPRETSTQLDHELVAPFEQSADAPVGEGNGLRALGRANRSVLLWSQSLGDAGFDQEIMYGRTPDAVTELIGIAEGDAGIGFEVPKPRTVRLLRRL